MLTSRVAAVLSSAPPSGAVESFIGKPTMPDIVFPNQGRTLVDFANAPSPDAHALASYLYVLYLKIFHLTSFGVDNPKYLQSHELNQLEKAALVEMAKSTDPYIRRFAEASPSSERVSIDNLILLNSRTGASRVLGETIFSIVLLVYGDRQYTFQSDGDDEVFASVPDMFGNLRGEFKVSLSSYDIPGYMKLSPFWKFVTLAFCDEIVKPEPTSSKQVARIARNMCDLVSSMARPMAPEAQLAETVTVSFANAAAMQMVTHRLHGHLAGEFDSTRQRDDRNPGRAAIINFMSNQGFKIVDLEMARYVYGLVIPKDNSVNDLRDGLTELSDGCLVDFYMDAMRVLSDRSHAHTFKPHKVQPLSQDIALEAAALGVPIDDDDDFDTPPSGEAGDEPESKDGDTESGDVEEDGDLPMPNDMSPEGGASSEESPPGECDDNNSIAAGANVAEPSDADLIKLASDGGSLNDYLYQRAVLKAYEVLEQTPELGLSQEKLDVLRDWCLRWLWIASIEDTKTIVNRLGLKSIFKAIPVGRTTES